MYKFKNNQVFLILFFILSLKFLVFYLLSFDFFNISLGGSKDSDYYHAYAIGNVDYATSVWPIILRFFNDLGVYNRIFFSFILFIIASIAIPILVIKIADLKKEDNLYWLTFLFLNCMPTIFYNSMDVYRDIFMLYILMLAIFCIKKISLNYHIIINTIFLIFLTWLLYGLRPYLAVAFILSVFIAFLKFSKRMIFIYAVLWLLALFIANNLGLFESVLEYRESFSDVGANAGGSNLNLDFSNPIFFIPNFILSFLAQNFGLFFPNMLSIVLFLLESLPMILMSIYILKHFYSSYIVKFLLVFSIVYASMWCISNSNLGTAVRLRFFNYFAIYCCFLIVYQVSILKQRKY